ncbi:MAG TPA: hypothetical protein VGO18_31310 [Steroidobacteraceae bacterium]|jgi:hypothetical protein|nr:hypothetical protein [Steroidobacteraceae bacterium]
MQAEVIDLLSGKGKFPTEQALVLAEAIDMAIEKTQFVTVPILDARFAAVNARIDSLEARMDLKLERWAVKMVIAMLLSQTALGPIGMGALDAVRRALSTLVH